ncbi:MAG TPA: hypothetical protein VKD65_04710 [Candidatus Angelobacter sp.]|nr:hypothetical protein [Candidatus Angelobacter sp.]
MKSRTLIIALSVALLGIPLYAQHGHGGGGGGGGTGHSMNSNSNSHNNSGKDSKGSSVSDHLEDNTKLASKLQSLLPPGTNLQQAAQGFKNLGQFVAAVHVSHNLGIPFDQLKAKMIGPPKESLGDAIHALKPTANAKEEAKKGEKQAKHDMDDSKTS